MNKSGSLIWWCHWRVVWLKVVCHCSADSFHHGFEVQDGRGVVYWFSWTWLFLGGEHAWACYSRDKDWLRADLREGDLVNFGWGVLGSFQYNPTLYVDQKVVTVRSAPGFKLSTAIPWVSQKYIQRGDTYLVPLFKCKGSAPALPGELGGTTA
jgi:hypothetical protein